MRGEGRTLDVLLDGGQDLRGGALDEDAADEAVAAAVPLQGLQRLQHQHVLSPGERGRGERVWDRHGGRLGPTRGGGGTTIWGERGSPTPP